MDKKRHKDKSGSKVITVTVIVIAVLLAVILLAIFAVPVITANARISEARKCFDAPTEISVMIISDPLYDGSLIGGEMNVFPEGEDLFEISDEISDIIKNRKYSETRKNVAGGWDINVSIGDEEGRARVYFTENEFYVVKGQMQFVFTPNDKVENDYSAFYEKLENMLAESASKQ